ncbi:MAG: 2-hydroxyacyl-CoA dehydratase [Deltaproteobacteria bacterium]|nr:2-hydroxyacyl-CoA dehydratase [Deltaproteobacteria bacterium]
MGESAPAPLSIPTRKQVIAQHKLRGGRVAAVLPVHYPRALFAAFDILPVEVWGPPGRDTAEGDAHLPAYACSIVRSALAFLAAGGLDAADYLVVPHTCDALQGLGSVLLDFVRPAQAVLPLYLPRDGGEKGRAFLAAEIRALFERLVELTGRRPGEAELRAAIARDEQADALLARVSRGRAGLALGDRELYALLRSREFLPPEQFCELAAQALERRGRGERAGTGVVISGMVVEPLAILDVLARGGAVVVADDLGCCGRRLYPLGHSDDPFTRLAERLVAGSPDPTRGGSVRERAALLRALCADFGARAVIFTVVKFCEPELFFVPLLSRALEGRGLRCLTIETDVSQPLPAQVTTRIEALLESLT